MRERGVLGVGLPVMGILLASIVFIRLLGGILYIDHALLSIDVIALGFIVALAGRKLSSLREVIHDSQA